MYDDVIADDLMDAPVADERAREIMTCRLAVRAMDAVAIATDGLRLLIECEEPLDPDAARSAISGAIPVLSRAWYDLDRSLSLS